MKLTRNNFQINISKRRAVYYLIFHSYAQGIKPGKVYTFYILVFLVNNFHIFFLFSKKLTDFRKSRKSVWIRPWSKMWRDFAVISQLHVLQTNNGSRGANEGKTYKAKDVVE